MSLLLDPWMANLSLSWWLTFISYEVSDSIKIPDFFYPQTTKEWNPVAVIGAFREVLGDHIMSIVLSIHRVRMSTTSFDVRIRRLSYFPRDMTTDLYRLYQGEPHRNLDDASFERSMSIHERVSFFRRLL